MKQAESIDYRVGVISLSSAISAKSHAGQQTPISSPRTRQNRRCKHD
jgi:hypothetical protein